MMQPSATSGAVAKPNSSAPSNAATITSRPVFNWPSVSTAIRLRRLFNTKVWCASARPSSDANFRNELHADTRLRVRVLQVVDQLGEVFDRINIMVRRRRNEADTRSG